MELESKTYYVSSGDIKESVQATSALEACKTVIRNSPPGSSAGRIMRVSDKGFSGRDAYYVATELVIEAAGHAIAIVAD